MEQPQDTPEIEHPFKQWKREKNLTMAVLVALLAQEGQTYTVESLGHTLSGRRKTSWALAKAMQKITRNAVKAEQLMEWNESIGSVAA